MRSININPSAFIILGFGLTLLHAGDPVGISKNKPADQRSVEIDGGYMVPYTTAIPGTDISFEMIPIPGGTYVMGSANAEDHPEEASPVSVTVQPFWMAKYEITWREYKEFMQLHDIFIKFQENGERTIEKESVDALTAPSNLYEPSFTFGFGDHPNQPAITMSQFAAKQYTKWLSVLTGQFFRLPSEAEWEYAARGGTTTKYSFGDDASKLGQYAWFKDNSKGQPQIVGQKLPNPFGLYDMHGNVAEWTLDAYTKDGFSHLKGKSYAALDTVNWPTEVYGRCLRGGSWELSAENCRSTSRLASEEDWKIDDPNLPQSPYWYTTQPGTSIGFRLMRPLKTPKTFKERNHFWKVHVDEIWEIVVDRSEIEGKGAFGKLDKTLPQAVKEAQ